MSQSTLLSVGARRAGVIFFAISFIGIAYVSSENVWAVNGQEKAKQEIKENVDKIRSNIQSITKNLETLDENIRTAEKNLAMIEQEVNVKKKAREEVNANLERTEKSLSETKRSQDDFEKGRDKDQELVETTKRDIEITKKRLAQLQENLKILQENVEIDKENIEKVIKARELWEKNIKSYKAAAGELDQLRKELEAQHKGQKDILERNNGEKKRWAKQLDLQKNDLEQIEAELKKFDEIKKK